MTNENFIVLQGWMVNELHLKGNELIAYALIYGFSQDGKSEFKGSMHYITETLGVVENSARATIQKLIEKNLIIRRIETINGVPYYRYCCVPNQHIMERPQKTEGGTSKTEGGTSIFEGGTSKIAPNNIDYNIEYRINDNINNKDYSINEQEKKSNTNVLPKEKPAKPKTPTFDFYGALIADGVPEQIAQDWMAVRKKNGAIDTETAYKGLQREAKKANMTIAEAVQMAAENSWRGFKAIWVERARLERQKAQGLTPNEAYRQQVAHDMLHPKTEIGKSYNRMFGLPVLNENDEEEEFQPYENRYQIENHYPF